MKQQIIENSSADHNYLREIERLHRQGVLKTGEVRSLDVAHDD